MTWEELVSHIETTCERVNDATMAYAWTLYQHATGAKAIMEIGIGPEAVSGTTFAAAMGEGGTLYSLDIEASRPTAEQVEFVSSLGVTWVISHGDTLESNFQPNRLLDVLYIDGNHGAEHIAHEFKTWGPCVVSGGFIIFDDYRTGDAPPIGLINAVHHEYDTAHHNGHFIYRKP
jgi:predicted O-methyltransferase YrrM